MSRTADPHLMSEEEFVEWRTSFSTEEIMRAMRAFHDARERLAKEQLYENSDADAAQKIWLHKEAVRLSNQFISDLIGLDYDGYCAAAQGQTI